MPLTLRSDSTEYVTGTVSADHDISGDVIEVATPARSNDPEIWHAAEVISVTPVNGRWIATYRLLIGPTGGQLFLSAGTYSWLVRVTDNPEQPVRQADTLTVV